MSKTPWRYNPWLQAVGNLLFPPLRQCSLCQAKLEKESDHGVCPNCSAGLPFLADPVCPVCGTPFPGGEICGVCRQRQTPFTANRSLLAYQDKGRDLILDYKYRFQPSLADFFAAELTARRLPQYHFEQPPWLTWVPMTRSRLRERGYNPALLLAEALSVTSGYPLQNTLVKTSQPPDQHGLNREQRWQVLADVYQPIARLQAAGQVYLLIDDVYTTGATLHFCASALRKAGAKEVFCLTAGLTL